MTLPTFEEIAAEDRAIEARQRTKHLWQLERTMSSAQFNEILADLNLSMAACARYLGVSTTTAARYRRGTATIPTATALLLRAVRDLGVQLIVPPWRADPHKHW